MYFHFSKKLILLFIWNIISESSVLSEDLNETITIYNNCLKSKFIRLNSDTRNYSFHSIHIEIFLTGSYSFTSNSSIDTYGSFHHSSIDLTNLYKSMITFDDNSADNKQFQIKLGLLSKKLYNLIVTTAIPNIIECFTIIVKGPARVHLIPNDIFFQEITTSTTTIPPIIHSIYSGILSTNSLSFSRDRSYYTNPNYYYEAIEMIISTTGIYTFFSESSMDTYGYLYKDSFDPLFPSENLIKQDDNSNNNYQFLIEENLENKHKYILIITTDSQSITGNFLIKVKGPSLLNLTTINSPISIYSNILSINSSIYSRFQQNENRFCYYYQAIEIKINTNGIYTFFSESSMDTYGYIYNKSFNPLYASENLMKTDDNSGKNEQFRINLSLKSHHTYVLVVTTYQENIKGNFLIKVLGPNNVQFQSIPSLTINNQSCIDHPRSNPYIPNHSDTTCKRTTIAMIVSIWILVILICCCCCYDRYKKKTSSNRQAISLKSNSNNNNYQQEPPSYQSVLPITMQYI